MEQLYLIEFMIDRVAIFVPDDNEFRSAEYKLILKVAFGPKHQFIIKEQQLAKNPKIEDVIIQCDENGHRKWSRIFRVGKSFLFPSYSDTVLNILDKFPLEIEVWNDDENEAEDREFVGIGRMFWKKDFFQLLKDSSSEACKVHGPLSIKERTTLLAECCCKEVGEIDLILRVTAMGGSIVTDFQQLMEDPESFVFRTDRAPSMFKCKRVEGDDPKFVMTGSLYETTRLEDPDVNAPKKIEVCTELQSCGQKIDADLRCEHEQKSNKKKYPIDKIKMGDIRGPCGNANCALAHKVRCYIRNLDSYKEKAGSALPNKDNITKKVCGACDCKDDRYHREECPETKPDEKIKCQGCGGSAMVGHTCKELEDKMKSGLKTTNKPSTGSGKDAAAVAYVLSVPTFKDVNYGIDFSYYQTLYADQDQYGKEIKGGCGCGCSKSKGCTNTSVVEANRYNSLSVPNLASLNDKKSSRSITPNNLFVYNVSVAQDKLCLDIPDDKDCKCNPPVPTPPCKTLDCECLTEAVNLSARKKHKAYCPLYKHKSTCPVRRKMREEDDEYGRDVEDEDVAEPLPYGLPPIKLGPCPVMGRPCSVPDGFARMYKTGLLEPLPPSYSDAGKVCCSKEFERIKAAIKEYMKYEKERDMRCVNTFNVDTEKRCCDKEQIILSQMGKSCCGTHKLQEKPKQDGK